MLLSNIFRPLSFAATALLTQQLLAGVVHAQAATPPEYPPTFNEPIPLYDVLGHFQRRITTNSTEAQAFFDQGVRMIYAFTLQDAARSFREAQKHDPTCAMCFFGEAWAWGPYLNGAMSAANAPRAYHAIQQALKLKSGASPVEQALIDAMAVRYAPVHEPSTRASLDTAYSAAMADVYSRFGNDLDVGTLYAESLMLLNRQRGTYEIDQPHVIRFHTILDGILRQDMHHPGACHLYIHATEATSRPDKAEECAKFLGNAIPGASHINHMPSHTFNRVGRWGDAVRANIDAWHTDQKAGSGEGLAILPTHNLHMLLYAASYDGQGAIATQAARDYSKLARNGTYYIALTLVRFGRFDEVLALSQAPSGDNALAQWDFARGYSHLRLGSADSARYYLAKVDGVLQGGSAGRTNSIVTIVASILRAELLAHDGLRDSAIVVMRAAVATEDDMAYAEPEALPFTARHWLGALLLESGRHSEAEAVYRDDLVKHPRNGWSLFGLVASLRAQQKMDAAELVRGQFADSWQRSDIWLRSSRF